MSGTFAICKMHLSPSVLCVICCGYNFFFSSLDETRYNTFDFCLDLHMGYQLDLNPFYLWMCI